MVDLAEFAYKQRCEQDRFESYRWGRPWSEGDRQDEIASRAVPHIAPENEFNILRSAQLQIPRNQYRRSGMQNYRPRHTGLAAFGDLQTDEKRQNVRELERLMWQFRGNLFFSRSLGWGGQSLASLWTWQNAAGGRRCAVLKNAIGAGRIRKSNQDTIDDERGFLRILGRAKHIIQRFNVANLLGSQTAGGIDDRRGILWLEWAKKGDLDSILTAVGTAVNGRNRPRRAANTDYVPAEVVWHIFRCLVTACISMAFPPRLQAGPDQDSQFDEFGPPLPEAVPPAADPGRQQHDIVHLDIDPNNVFVAEYDNDHPDVPIFKIADLGASDTANGTRVDDALPFFDTTQKWIWDIRSKGKVGHYLPEQFTSAWDRVKLYSDPFTDGITTVGNPADVAANYGPWSNIWQIGLVLWSCMTLLEPDEPPVPKPMPGRAGANAAMQWTYGAEIMGREYIDRYGREMCELVARCLMHRPVDRPTLDQLQTNLDRIRPAVTSQRARTWVRRYVHDAPPANDRLVDFDYALQYRQGRGVVNPLMWFEPRRRNVPRERFDPFT
ncbi:hypothetical protein VMCG_06859 [Cytospora schulzeri]|uniref:Protein kinase domain-containing protein n=1 Tax=Cytospora schulzeri TaxID=448051 RepID=A0A423W295_9PEZI|nr:hypothetical protein VMCG_06859 [Valsa malicola]